MQSRCGYTYKHGEKLEAVPRSAILREGLLVLENEGNLDNTGDSSRHQGVSEHRMCSSARHQLLGMSRHGPTSHHDNKSRNEVALGVSVTIPAEPDTSQASAPPNDTHGGVLPVVLHPGGAPAMLSKGIDTSPGSNDGAVEELLRASAPAHPHLTDKENDGEEDSVGDEGTAHDKMGGALAEMIALAESESGDAAEEHLGPG